MNTVTTCICVLGLSGIAFGDVLMDQIGLDDGTSIGTNTIASQNFETSYDHYDVAVLDNFTGDGESINMVEIVLNGWNGFSDPSYITGYTTNLYSDPSVAAVDLAGDIDSNYIDAADASISSAWGGEGYLVEMLTQMLAVSDTNWVSVIPDNVFASNGQTGVHASLIGDGVMGWQANPGGGFGLEDNYAELVYEVAYRLHTGDLPDPCDDELPALCPEDITSDGMVSVNDVLAVIGDWGVCGDGTFRPEADIAPLPNGDCCVDVTDILAVVGAWGADCNIYGGCCLADGSCAEDTSENCATSGGVYFGDDSTCADGPCDPAACCLSDLTCSMLTFDGCISAGGQFHGNDDCLTWDCSIPLLGDECSNAIAAVEGANPFDTDDMSPSQPQPDEDMCSDSAFLWEQSPDVWFEWVAPETGGYDIDTCDWTSFDTSMVIYQDTCANQIACNGDAANTPDCQDFYSHIILQAIANKTYYIRIGGWQATTGSGTLNINHVPEPLQGACCLTVDNCLDTLDSDECASFGGDFAGEFTVCADDPCSGGAGFEDECANAGPATLGENSFDTSLMSPSQPQPDDTMCAGTYLDWDNSPDGWFAFTAQSSLAHHFTTCDAAASTYDTSMVLYEGDCNTQVACNGDGAGNAECQAYYSAIDYTCTEGTTYYIRIGGWEGGVGEGTLTISVEDPNELAACCDLGSCLGDITVLDCDNAGGVWVQGELCATYTCPVPDCVGALFSQNVHGPDVVWSAGTSSDDPTNGFYYNRAELVNLSSMSNLSVWGLQSFYDNGWGDCVSGQDYGFNVRAYDDDGGIPGAMSTEVLDATAVKTSTGDLYGGIYECFRFDMNFAATNVDWIAVQSASDGVGCWFMWLSSETGDADSALDTGNGWSMGYGYDLSLCIN